MTTTATHTITHTITEISESTVPPSTTTEIEPAAVERLSVRAVVTDVTMYVDYIRDSRIINAYKHVMEDISGLSEHWIALQMFPGAAGNITVDYILTVPFVEGAGGELVPIVPVEQVQGKLDAVTPETFNTMLKEKVDEATGAGTHSQKVVSFEQDTSDSGNGSVSSALRLGGPLKCSLASIIFLMLASIVGSNPTAPGETGMANPGTEPRSVAETMQCQNLSAESAAEPCLTGTAAIAHLMPRSQNTVTLPSNVQGELTGPETSRALA
eukprot:CAMPEP_0181457678 /NCGR_PEP_ID=MMETSP1110-20121109/31909_1 /TAXON_ID=174948 /ORGANISM="Symbiodinium sp., Strain CCMP421" /LENGTH=268 /DNA_ID=CAMNT_0023582125 /DNA_START=298 /DNA_END=1105 /DNA_ORIENTATION=-